MKRQEQQVENTWRLEDIYENEDLFSRDAEKLDALMVVGCNHLTPTMLNSSINL